MARRSEQRPGGAPEAGAPDSALSEQEKVLLDAFQRDFPLVPRPYAEVAARLGLSEDELLEMLRRLRAAGVLSRVGAVVRPRTVGASTLAAMAVPAERLEDVAALVSARPEVNHNYEREHRYNLWFVVTAPDRPQLGAVLADLEAETGLPVIELPLLKDYHIDLGFRLQWS